MEHGACSAYLPFTLCQVLRAHPNLERPSRLHRLDEQQGLLWLDSLLVRALISQSLTVPMNASTIIEFG